jgi:hypothetical protein
MFWTRITLHTPFQGPGPKFLGHEAFSNRPRAGAHQEAQVAQEDPEEQ